ncbi:hypothetical protein HK104_008340 [Borealophlyctis nickersoniae]|nr:hypothetical protein HK104_008340 [Borealophlyctis nickersoniae]
MSRQSDICLEDVAQRQSTRTSESVLSEPTDWQQRFFPEEMTNYKSLIQHCRALLSLHHEFARRGFRTGAAAIHDAPRGGASKDSSSDDYEVYDGTKLDLAQPMVVSEEEILDKYLKDKQITDEKERVFLTETFNGCVRQRKIIEIALEQFYVKTGGRYLRSEYNLFAEDLTFAEFHRFVRCFDAAKMARFIAFLFDPANVEGDLKAGWGKILDHAYVQEQLVDPILANIPNAEQLLKELCERAAKGMVPSKSLKPATEPEPFLLTRPQPRKLPEPTVIISTCPKARPVPKSVYSGTGEKEVLEKAKIENRERVQELYEKAQKDQFAVAARKPSDKIERLRKQIEEEQQARFEQDRPRPHKPVTSTISTSPPVKLTTAAILREDALVRRQRKKEEEWLNEVETGLRDASEFSSWRGEAKEKEEEERKIELERRRLEIQLLHEDTFVARQELLKENRVRVAELQAEKEILKVQAEAARREHDEENRKKIEEVHEIQESIQKAKVKVVEENSKKAADLSLENKLLREKAQREAEEEWERKVELITQIRLLEKSIPPVGSYVKTVDLAETSGIGLLGEMSVVELQERLVLAKVRHRDWEAAKREDIGIQKKERMEEILRKMETIDREREERRRRRERGKPKVVAKAHSNVSSRAPSVMSGREDNGALGSRSSSRQSLVERNPALRELQAKLEAKRAGKHCGMIFYSRIDNVNLIMPTHSTIAAPKTCHEKWNFGTSEPKWDAKIELQYHIGKKRDGCRPERIMV